MISRLRIGSRGSALALTQARLVEAAMRARFPSVDISLAVIKTTGDKMAEAPLSQISGKGVFIKEIQEALLSREIDLAVHSLKDLPTEPAEGLRLGAVMEREDPRDCVVSRFGEQLLELPRGAIVGTSSLRRQAQVRAAKKTVRVQDIRGNLDTRLRKVMNGDVDSIIVAYAGVRRLKREDDVSEVLPFDLMLPAPGQGCLGLETRAGDDKVSELVSALNHEPSGRAAEAERAFLSGLGGGCRVPIAAYARLEKGQFILDGLAISPDGGQSVRGRLSGPPEQAARLGAELARQLLSEGASKILEQIQNASEAGLES